MYLFGLSSALTLLVSTANPADLNAAIERTRLVKAEYNYTSSKGPIMRGNKHETEVDDLSKKIEQLSLNYATLASALAIQPVQNNSRRSTNYNNNSNNYRSKRPTMSQASQFPRQNNDRICYNCNQSGHIARNCLTPRRNQRRTHFSNFRNVHYLDL